MNGISNFRMELYSSAYYGCLNSFSRSDFETTKLLGRFFTNHRVADTMIHDLFERIDLSNDKITIIDPFCGDGRLIVSFINKIATENFLGYVDVTIWDIDNKNVEEASYNIIKAAEMAGVCVRVASEAIDTFAHYVEYQHSFDICITNPPWSILKPQKIFADKYDSIDKERFNHAISLYDSYIKKEFHISQPTSKFGKWGTNLARCGTEVALRLIKPNGFCSIVSPASLLSDQVSECFRKWIFERHTLLNINYYVAEAKLYGKADVNSVSLLLQNAQTSDKIKVRSYNESLNFEDYIVSSDEFEYIKRNGYVFPFETGIGIISTLRRLESLPVLGDIDVGLRFCRELDETRVNERLSLEGTVLFAKGYMVDRYSFDPASSLYVNPQKCIIPDTIAYEKIAWRDVSRNSQMRRIKATILPPLAIAGNSLGVAYLKSPDKSRLRYLLAIVNSIIFECQARALLVTNHVSSGIMKRIHIPVLKKEVESVVVPLVNRRLAGDFSVDPYIESYIAVNYGIPLHNFLDISRAYYVDSLAYSTLCDIANQIYNKNDL